MKLELQPPRALGRIVRTLQQAGHDTWVVGGVVRDALIGSSRGDWDLATQARPGRVRKIFRRTVPLGMEHGTVGVIGDDGVVYQVTTFRRDVRTDGRHAKVRFADRIEDDLARRDFTINALAWHPMRGELLDPYQGATHLRTGLLKTVGTPSARFREDYLRILRGLRFAGRFELRVERGTWLALCNATKNLTCLSAERVRDELLKVLGEDPRPAGALRMYAASGALAVLYPELEALRTTTRPRRNGPPDGPACEASVRPKRNVPPGDPACEISAPRPGSDAFPGNPACEVSPSKGNRAGGAGPRRGHVDVGCNEWRRTLSAVTRLGRTDHFLRLAALLRSCPLADAKAVVTRLRLSRAQQSQLLARVDAPPLPGPTASDGDLRRWLASTGSEALYSLVRLELARAGADWVVDGPRDGSDRARHPADLVASWRRLRAIRRRGDPITLGDLAMDGAGLKRLGVASGPAMGWILRRLLAAVVEDPAENTVDRLRARALALIPLEGAPLPRRGRSRRTHDSSP